MDPKMALEPPCLELFFTCGSKPCPWPHFCQLVANLWPSKAPCWAHLGPLFGPQAPIWDHMVSGYVLEIFDNLCLEHRTSYTDTNTSSKLVDAVDVLEIMANRFLDHRTSHTDINTSSKLVHTGDVLELFDNPFLE